MRPLTLRTRTTLLATLVTGLTLVLGSIALVVTLDAHLRSGADDLAQSRVRDLLALAASGNLPRTLTNLDDNGVAQVVTADGSRVLAASPNVRSQGRIADFDPGSRLVVETVRAPDDAETETYRLWAGTGDSPDGPVVVYVGTALESVHEATHTLRRSLYVGVPLAVLLLGLGTWLVLGGALRRIDRIRAEVDTITEDRLDARVPGSGVDDEVGRLADTMNGMLGRLEASARRQRDFVADVSHDLQSPLAAQRAQLEVALTASQDGLARDVLATTEEMERLVADLLVLAAADSGPPAAPPVLLDLEDVVLEEAARARTTGRVAIDTSRVSAAPALGHDTEVRRIVRNLLDNALAHAVSRVELRVASDDSSAGPWARLDVLDDGRGVPPEERERIFDRFHRGDASRSRHTSGSGLGLAIARTLAERAGGSLEVAPDDGTDDGATGAHFVLRLPAGPVA